MDLAKYLANNQASLGFDLDVNTFRKELAEGLYFQSTIPIGYGVGSSGAVTAGIYDRYVEEEVALELDILKERLAVIESFFHGESSGIDPLICYLDQPILIESKTKIRKVVLSPSKEKGSIFLLNTGIARQTEPLVKIFLENCKDEYYDLRCQSELAPLNDEAISVFIKRQWKDLFEIAHEISYFQYKHFQSMIPKGVKNTWLEGLGSDLFKLKLCGAGGGGFMLGFTKDMIQTKAMLKAYPIKEVCKV